MHRTTRCLPVLVSLLVSAISLRADDNTAVSLKNGIQLHLKDREVQLLVAGPHAFCLHVSLQPDAGPYPTTILTDPPATPAPFTVVNEGANVGLKTSFGQVLIDPAKEAWTMRDATGATLTDWASLGHEAPPRGPGKPESYTLAAGISPTIAKPFYYGPGNEPVRGSLNQPAASRSMGNGGACLAQYWTTAGYGAILVSKDSLAAPSWQSQPKGHVDLTVPGEGADIYLLPAHNLYEWLRNDAELTGFAPVPPLWSFGYLQSRWGWKDKADIDATFAHFRQDQLPVDAFILDFEWYTHTPDYSVPANGDPKFVDFDYNPVLLPDPKQQFADFRQQGLRIIGIRKPRVANADTLAMARAKGWILPVNPNDPNGNGGPVHRNLDFSNPDVRAWWEQNNRKFVEVGMPGFWNDEGEVNFNEYYFWNVAELDLFHQVDPQARFWSINRSFTAGMQRLGAAAWTGDIRSNWQVLQGTTGDLLGYSLAGMPYSACDIGGFEGKYPGVSMAELLPRWMEAGVFFPVMRAHSERNVTPHFPWLFGPDAEIAIKKALDLRYRLIPLFYSLAHENHLTAAPIMRPLVMEFPDDPNVATLTSEWLMGRGLLVAPILASGQTRSVYLPKDRWYTFCTNQATDGPQTINVTAKLDEIPIYIRAGTLLPLAPVRLNTSDMTNTKIEMQVYSGRDATFDLVEDDGQTLDYQTGGVRKVSFQWNEASQTLSWKTTGSYNGPNVFHTLNVELFGPRAQAKMNFSLDQDGSIAFAPSH